MHLDDRLPDNPHEEPKRPPSDDPRFEREELALAFRNRGLPLEALRYDVTPSGLHYLLIHFDIPATRPDGWTLRVDGRVQRPVEITLEDIMPRPSVTRRITMECAGNGRARMKPRPVSQPWLEAAVGTAEWTGTPLRPWLEQAGLERSAVDVVFTGIDAGIEAGEVQRYRRSLSVAEALSDDVLLVWAMNGRPLEPQHGAPLRLIVAGWYGMASVKWLAGIEVIDRPFDGHYMVGTYRYAVEDDEPGEAVTVQRVRSLLVPPGIPDFYTRRRLMESGEVRLQGRAWAGRRAVVRVEVSPDGGRTFFEADLEPPHARCCWQSFSWLWPAEPGEHVLVARATDDQGDTQPLEATWNRYGMGNNVAQQVEVTVV